jgi:hypothetical protein
MFIKLFAALTGGFLSFRGGSATPAMPVSFIEHPTGPTSH